MKNLPITSIFALLLIALGHTVQAQTIVAIEDFDGGTPSWVNDVASQAFVDPSSSDEGLFIQASTNIGSGTTAYGRDLGGESGEPTLSPYTFTFDPVSVTAANSYEISFDYYAFANADSGSYEILIDGVGQGAVEWYNDPDTTAVQGTITVPVSGANTIGLVLTGTLNGGNDVIELDNIQLVELTGLQPPSGLSGTPAASPNNKSQINVSYTPNASNDVLLVYSTEDSFGAPVDTNSYSAGDSLPGGGTVAGVFSGSPASVTELAPGTPYYFVAFSVDSSINYSEASASFTSTTDTFALQLADFDGWIIADVLNTTTWSVSGTSASATGFSQATPSGSPSESWLISPVLNLDSLTDETFEFTYSDNFSDTITGLELYYTNDYTEDPGTTTWTAFTAQNTEFDDYVATGSGSVETSLDLSSISGTTIRLAFKYTSTDDGSSTNREWNLNAPLISGNNASDPAITLAASPAAVAEGGTLAVTLSLPSNVTSNTEFFLSSNGDGSELGFPASVTILNGTNSIGFNVFGLNDNLFDNDQIVTLVANAAGHTFNSLDITVNNIDTQTPSGDLIITQYYESGSNKYIELTNIGTSSVDLTGYTLARWGNARAEEYKTATSAPADDYDTLDLSPLGTLFAGETAIIANSDSSDPLAAGSAALTQGFPGAVTFNGNDSVVIYNSSTPAPSNIVDAIGFTDAGNEGSDVSFVRAAAVQGYDLSPGSNVSSSQFAAVWTQVTTQAVADAVFGDDEFLGSTDLATAPTSVGFTTSSQSVQESDGSFDLEVQITDLTSGTVTVDVTFNAGSSTSDTNDFTFTSPTQLVFDASNLTNPQTITITIIDDGLESGTEVASFDLSISSGTSLLGATSTHEVNIQDSDFVVPDIIISEVVDPGSISNAKYVELYNASGSTVDLSAGTWTLTRYANANTGGADIPLTGTIAPGGTYVVANNDTDYGSYAVGSADQTSGSISGNGDDTYALYFGGSSTTGTLIDIYGNIGTDGTGEAWEYVDSRAVRNAVITSGNTTWTSSEWTIESASAPSGPMTPGVHPDTLVETPTSVSATTVSESEISIAFTPGDSNDVIIVFDTDGTFSAPTGTQPSVSDTFAGGTVLYVGQASPFAHTGLSAGTSYFYSVFSVSGTNYSNTVEVDATTSVAGIINEENFDDAAGDAEDWFNATVIGDDAWDFSQSDGYIDGSVNSGTGADEHYLVSPPLDFSSATGITVTFDYAGGFDVESLDSLELVYSTDYLPGDTSDGQGGDPEASASWTPIDFNFTNVLSTAASTSDLLSSGAIPLDLAGESTVYLAFRYNSDGTVANSEMWIIDNIVVAASGSTADPLGDYLSDRGLTSGVLETDTNGNGFTVLEEYLASFGDGAGNDRITYGVDATANALTLTSDSGAIPTGITVVLKVTNDLMVTPVVSDYTVNVTGPDSNGDYTIEFVESVDGSSPTSTGQRFYFLEITAN